MKTILSVCCCIGVFVLLSACDSGDSGGSSGGRGDYPEVSFIKDGSGDDEHAVCYNADNSVITTKRGL